MDVVLVHGITGDPKETWWCEGENEFWPKWLCADLDGIAIYSLGYPAALFEKWAKKEMDLFELAGHTLEFMVARGIGERPIAFIAHSLGGIVTKQILRSSSDAQDEDWKKVSLTTRLVIFLATPHTGASLANTLKFFLPRISSKFIDLLSNDTGILQDINNHYRSFANSRDDLSTVVYYEKYPTKNIMVVVSRESADPGVSGAQPIAMEKNHINICKPNNKMDDLYVSIHRHVLKVLGSVGMGSRGNFADTRSIERDSQIQLEHFAREITTNLAGLENHAKLIAKNSVIVQFLMDGKNEPTQSKARQELLGHTEIGPYATTFLLDRDGICVENSLHELSKGKNYSFRPYFKDARQKKIGRFPAIGVTSGVLGFHVSYPVLYDGEFIGAACVEVDMQKISKKSDEFVQTETRGREEPWIRVLADQNGVIILSSEDSWIYRTLAAIPKETLQLVRETEQYPGQDLAEIERFESPDIQLLSSAMPNLTFRGLRWKDSLGDVQNQVFAVRQAQLDWGWQVLIFWRLTISPE